VGCLVGVVGMATGFIVLAAAISIAPLPETLFVVAFVVLAAIGWPRR
jgi:hypothetical protein